MTVTISGSMQFFDHMQQLAERLEAKNHKVFLPLPSPADKTGQLSRAQKTTHMHEHIGFIKQSDALLVANYKKNGIANYIGANTFLEMGVAFAFHKLIYLLNPLPELSYSEEMKGFEPIVLHNDLSRINAEVKL